MHHHKQVVHGLFSPSLSPKAGQRREKPSLSWGTCIDISRGFVATSHLCLGVEVGGGGSGEKAVGNLLVKSRALLWGHVPCGVGREEGPNPGDAASGAQQPRGVSETGWSKHQLQGGACLSVCCRSRQGGPAPKGIILTREANVVVLTLSLEITPLLPLPPP